MGILPDRLRRRTDLTKACPDNDAIPRVAGAGQVRDGWLTMHNGIEVAAFSYNGEFGLTLMHENRGVHEPQEERVFMDVLPHIAPGSTMIELGAYWAFYSIWFAQAVPEARLVMVEPEFDNIIAGRMNLEHADQKARLLRGWVGSKPQDGDIPVLSVDQLMKEEKIDHVAILHCDIQGFEVEMLAGAKQALASRAVDYFFVSTHHQYKDISCHEHCLKVLEEAGYRILVSISCPESYSDDGLIVAVRPDLENVPELRFSRRQEAG